MPELTPVDRTIPPSFDYSTFSLPENVSLTFHLNPHKTAQDLPEPFELGTIVRNADIVIPEFIHDTETRDVMARISMGSQKDYDRSRDLLKGNEMTGWMQAMMSAIYASRTSTANIDISVHHRATRRYMESNNLITRGNAVEIRSRFNEVLENVTENLDALRERDQAILQNLAPEIERVIANNRNIAQKREKQPLDVRIFYGTAHRSLLDAVLVKEQVEGFSAQASADSIENDLVPSVYGKYLRNQDLAVEDIERMFAYSSFGSLVHNKKYLGDNPSGRLLTTTFLDLEDQLDTTNFTHLLQQVTKIFES